MDFTDGNPVPVGEFPGIEHYATGKYTKPDSGIEGAENEIDGKRGSNKGPPGKRASFARNS